MQCSLVGAEDGVSRVDLVYVSMCEVVRGVSVWTCVSALYCQAPRHVVLLYK